MKTESLAVIAALLLNAAALKACDRSPVLVELFTSEGCSSCPPADRLLAELYETQPISGAQVIVLSEHVDYWNQLGWMDPYSSSLFSDRQKQYANMLRVDDVYTPQAVIDGRLETVGNNAPKLQSAITEAAHSQKVPVTLDATRQNGSVEVRVAFDPARAHNTSVLVAIVEREVESKVSRGENGGHMLTHVGVVRSLTPAGKADSEGHFQATLKVDPQWGVKGLRVVAFLRERSGKVVGAAELKI